MEELLDVNDKEDRGAKDRIGIILSIIMLLLNSKMKGFLLWSMMVAIVILDKLLL